MRTLSRHIASVVLLALLLGHVSIAVHAAGHGDGELADCKICISYGNTCNALGGECAVATPAVEHVAECAVTGVLPPAAPCRLYRQRAPPLSR